MKTLKFYKYFAIIMLLLNISMVTFFVISKPKHPNKMGQKMPPPPVLNLSEVQSEQFYVLVNEHKIEMQSISDSQAEILTQYFKTLYEPNELYKEAALSNFCALENQKIQSTYNHFQDIQEMLNDDQLANFPEFIDKAMNHILRLKNKTSRPK